MASSSVRWPLLVGGFVVVVLLLGVGWELTPEEARGFLALVAGLACAALYLGLLAIQRRRHW